MWTGDRVQASVYNENRVMFLMDDVAVGCRVCVTPIEGRLSAFLPQRSGAHSGASKPGLRVLSRCAVVVVVGVAASRAS